MMTIPVAPTCTFLLIALAWGALPPAPDRPHNDAAGEPPPPLAELRRVAEQGKLNGVTIEYWVGGGLPPPFYRSDQLRLLTVENRDIFELSRPYRDPATKLEGLVEKLQLSAPPPEVRRLAQLLLDTAVFERHFPEGKDAGRADALTTEVIVGIGDRQYRRRYFAGLPKPLEPLRAEFERLVNRLVTSGTRGIFHRGKPVPLSQEPAPANAGEAEATHETHPLPRLADEGGRRIDRRLAVKERLVLWLNVSETLPDQQQAASEAVQQALKNKRGLIFATRGVAGAVPVPSGTPGGHVHMRVYAFEPHPDLVLSIGNMDGRICVALRDAGKDPQAPTDRWHWILCAR